MVYHKVFRHRNDLKEYDLFSETTSQGRWYVTPKGDRYKSVTTFLKETGDMSWLDDWREAVGEEIANKESLRCSTRGDQLHLSIENYLNNEHPFYNIPDLLNYVRYMFNQLKFVLSLIDDIVFQEVSLFSDKMRLAGKVDCIAKYNGKLSIIDFKSSNKLKKESDITNYFIQCTCYAIMYKEMYGVWIDQIVVIIGVEKVSRPQVFKMKTSDYLPELKKRLIQFHAKK